MWGLGVLEPVEPYKYCLVSQQKNTGEGRNQSVEKNSALASSRDTDHDRNFKIKYWKSLARQEPGPKKMRGNPDHFQWSSVPFQTPFSISLILTSVL